jgi:hypothetical protein
VTSSSDPALNTNQLPISFDVNPKEKEFEENLVLYMRRVANSVNTKTSGLYLLQENANFEQWFGTSPQQNRNAYRLTTDLVALNGSNIPTGTTTISLSTSTQPVAPIRYLYPIQGFGGALDTSSNSYFPSDPKVTISYNGSTSTFTIINNSGNALTWCVFVLEYLKN